MENYLYGNRVHKLDAKGRIAIPAHMRGRLGEEFIASLGLGDFIALYPQDQWEELLNKVQSSTLSTENGRIRRRPTSPHRTIRSPLGARCSSIRSTTTASTSHPAEMLRLTMFLLT